MNDNVMAHQKVICCITEPCPEVLDSDLLSCDTLFQLSEVPNTSRLRTISGTGNALTAPDARPPWWARNSSLGRMTSFATNVALLHSSVESSTAALFSLCNNVVHWSAERKPDKRYYSYLVIQVTFQE